MFNHFESISTRWKFALFTTLKQLNNFFLNE